MSSAIYKILHLTLRKKCFKTLNNALIQILHQVSLRNNIAISCRNLQISSSYFTLFPPQYKIEVPVNIECYWMRLSRVAMKEGDVNIMWIRMIDIVWLESWRPESSFRVCTSIRQLWERSYLGGTSFLPKEYEEGKVDFSKCLLSS